MPETQANGITIHYEDRGDTTHPAILLIMGIGGQMTLWPDDFLSALVSRGFRVIRFDNRDIGLSEKLDGVAAPGVAEIVSQMRDGRRPSVPYELADMANDAVGLLDALGILEAHIVGVSMGAMIAQHIAAKHSSRVLSLTCFSSTTGAIGLEPPKPAAARALAERPASLEEKALIDHGVTVAQLIGSPGFPVPENQLRERVRRDLKRSFYPEGPQRQRAAIVADGDRTQMIAKINVPTLVIHGEDDPIFPAEHGHAIAAAIAGAQIRTYQGLGHDLPDELIEPIATAIADHAMSATRR